MDTTSLYYFSEASKDLHITKTAKRLYISQQTLSNHIIRLENACGVKLFERKPKLALTYAGECVLNFANTIVREQQNLFDILSEIKNEEQGILRFGASAMRINSFLPEILPAFSQKYPGIELRIIDDISHVLEPMLLAGDLDLAVITPEFSNPDLVTYDLIHDQVYLCIADKLLRRYYGEETEELKEKSIEGAYVKDFARLPFCMLSNRMGKRIEDCFKEAGVTPKSYSVTSYIHIATALGMKGVAACFSTQTNLVNYLKEFPKDLNVFPLHSDGHPIMQHIALARHKDRYLSNYCKYFQNLISEYFFKVKHIAIGQIVKYSQDMPT